MIVDQLLIALGLDATEAKKEVQDLEKGFNNLLKIGTSIAGAFGVKGLLNNFIQVNREITTLSNTLGEDYEQIQVWGEAVKTTGGNVQGLESSIQSLNEGIQQTAITGNSSLLPVLNRLGISIRDGSGELKQGTDILTDLTNVFDKLTARQATQFGKQLGLDAGTIMLLKKGSEEVGNILEKQRLLGVYTREDSEVAQEYANSLDDLMQVLRSITAVFARVALPVFKKFNEMLTDVALFVRKYENFIKGFFIGISIAIGAFLIPKILGLAKAFVALNKSTLIITGIGATIGLIVDDFLTWKEGGDSLFGSMYDWLDKNRIALDLLIESFKILAGITISKQLLGLLGLGGAKTGAAGLAKLGLAGASLSGVVGAVGLGVGAYKLGMFGVNKLDDYLYSRQQKQFKMQMSGFGKGIKTKNQTNSSSTTIGKIEVITKATDSQGIVNSLVPALQNTNMSLINQNNGF